MHKSMRIMVRWGPPACRPPRMCPPLRVVLACALMVGSGRLRMAA
ncbi:MAG TPA: hypothetical protein VGO93_32090 [Candidatus Xenobia bacterium]